MLMSFLRPPSLTGQWKSLAGVARERASEQSNKAAAAPDVTVAEPHLEQQAYLVRLAEVYEEPANKGNSAI